MTLSLELKNLLGSTSTLPKATDKIRENLPKDTYTSVSVSATTHSFFGGKEVSSRCITLNPESEDFDAFAASVKKPVIGFRPEQHTFNGTAITYYILGMNKDQRGEIELKKAFNQKRIIFVYISEDCKSFKAEVKQVTKGIFGDCILQ